MVHIGGRNFVAYYFMSDIDDLVIIDILFKWDTDLIFGIIIFPLLSYFVVFKGNTLGLGDDLIAYAENEEDIWRDWLFV